MPATITRNLEADGEKTAKELFIWFKPIIQQIILYGKPFSTRTCSDFDSVIFGVKNRTKIDLIELHFAKHQRFHF